jgi:glycerol dehydrogenase-like iron-containing ADH family enzyme
MIKTLVVAALTSGLASYAVAQQAPPPAPAHHLHHPLRRLPPHHPFRHLPPHHPLRRHSAPATPPQTP